MTNTDLNGRHLSGGRGVVCEGWYVVTVTDLNGRPLPSKMWDGGGG